MQRVQYLNPAIKEHFMHVCSVVQPEHAGRNASNAEGQFSYLNLNIIDTLVSLVVHRGCLGRSGWNGRFRHVWVLCPNKVVTQTDVECVLKPRLWSFIWHVELMLLAFKWALYWALCTPGT